MFKRHHQYIVGRHVTIPTNHKPLLRILAEEMGIPQLAGLRLKRWAIILSGYNHTLKNKTRTSSSNADCLSHFLKTVKMITHIWKIWCFGRSSRITRNFFRCKK